jgi:hypothetical protein
MRLPKRYVAPPPATDINSDIDAVVFLSQNVSSRTAMEGRRSLDPSHVEDSLAETIEALYAELHVLQSEGTQTAGVVKNDDEDHTDRH